MILATLNYQTLNIMKASQSPLKTITRNLKNLAFKSNSSVIQRHELKQRTKVVWSGGTKISSFKKS